MIEAPLLLRQGTLMSWDEINYVFHLVSTVVKEFIMPSLQTDSLVKNSTTILSVLEM